MGNHLQPRPPGISSRETDAQQPVVLFDGVCNLCEGFVAWTIRHDPGGRVRFAPLQSEAARRLLAKAGAGELPDSVVLIDGDGVHTRSEAALRVAGLIGFRPWLVRLARLVPRPMRDLVYGVVARNRYRWFGRKDACLVPTAEVRDRFLDGTQKPDPARATAVRLRWIEHGSRDYEAMLQLRDEVLRRPLGLVLDRSRLDSERDARLLTAWDDKGIVGCLVLSDDGDGRARMRAVAVRDRARGQGVGRLMVAEFERTARELGFAESFAHARLAALPFYEALGYEAFGEVFEEVTIPHRRVRKPL